MYSDLYTILILVDYSKCRIRHGKNNQLIILLIILIFDFYKNHIFSSIIPVECKVVPKIFKEISVNLGSERHRSSDTQFCFADTNTFKTYEALPSTASVNARRRTAAGGGSIDVSNIIGKRQCQVSVRVKLIKDNRAYRTLCLYRETMDLSIFEQDATINVETVSLRVDLIYKNLQPVKGFILNEPNSVVQGYMVKKQFYGSVRMYDKYRLYHVVFYIEPISSVSMYNHNKIVDENSQFKENSVLFEYISNVKGSQWIPCNERTSKTKTQPDGHQEIVPATKKQRQRMKSKQQQPKTKKQQQPTTQATQVTTKQPKLITERQIPTTKAANPTTKQQKTTTEAVVTTKQQNTTIKTAVKTTTQQNTTTGAVVTTTIKQNKTTSAAVTTTIQQNTTTEAVVTTPKGNSTTEKVITTTNRPKTTTEPKTTVNTTKESNATTSKTSKISPKLNSSSTVMYINATINTTQNFVPSTEPSTKIVPTTKLFIMSTEITRIPATRVSQRDLQHSVDTEAPKIPTKAVTERKTTKLKVFTEGAHSTHITPKNTALPGPYYHSTDYTTSADRKSKQKIQQTSNKPGVLASNYTKIALAPVSKKPSTKSLRKCRKRTKKPPKIEVSTEKWIPGEEPDEIKHKIYGKNIIGRNAVQKVASETLLENFKNENVKTGRNIPIDVLIDVLNKLSPVRKRQVNLTDADKHHLAGQFSTEHPPVALVHSTVALPVQQSSVTVKSHKTKNTTTITKPKIETTLITTPLKKTSVVTTKIILKHTTKSFTPTKIPALRTTTNKTTQQKQPTRAKTTKPMTSSMPFLPQTTPELDYCDEEEEFKNRTTIKNATLLILTTRKPIPEPLFPILLPPLKATSFTVKFIASTEFDWFGNLEDSKGRKVNRTTTIDPGLISTDRTGPKDSRNSFEISTEVTTDSHTTGTSQQTTTSSVTSTTEHRTTSSVTSTTEQSTSTTTTEKESTSTTELTTTTTGYPTNFFISTEKTEETSSKKVPYHSTSVTWPPGKDLRDYDHDAMPSTPYHSTDPKQARHSTDFVEKSSTTVLFGVHSTEPSVEGTKSAKNVTKTQVTAKKIVIGLPKHSTGFTMPAGYKKPVEPSHYTELTESTESSTTPVDSDESDDDQSDFVPAINFPFGKVKPVLSIKSESGIISKMKPKKVNSSVELAPINITDIKFGPQKVKLNVKEGTVPNIYQRFPKKVVKTTEFEAINITVSKYWWNKITSSVSLEFEPTNNMDSTFQQNNVTPTEFESINNSSEAPKNTTYAYEASDLNSMADSDTLHPKVLQKLLQDSLKKQSTEHYDDSDDSTSSSTPTAEQNQEGKQIESQFISLEHIDDREVNNAMKLGKGVHSINKPKNVKSISESESINIMGAKLGSKNGKPNAELRTVPNVYQKFPQKKGKPIEFEGISIAGSKYRPNKVTSNVWFEFEPISMLNSKIPQNQVKPLEFEQISIKDSIFRPIKVNHYTKLVPKKVTQSKFQHYSAKPRTREPTNIIDSEFGLNTVESYIEREPKNNPQSKINGPNVLLNNTTDAYKALDVNLMPDSDTVHPRVLQKLLQDSLKKQSTENYYGSDEGVSTSTPTAEQKQYGKQNESQFISLEHLDDHEVNSKPDKIKPAAAGKLVLSAVNTSFGNVKPGVNAMKLGRALYSNIKPKKVKSNVSFESKPLSILNSKYQQNQVKQSNFEAVNIRDSIVRPNKVNPYTKLVPKNVTKSKFQQYSVKPTEFGSVNIIESEFGLNTVDPYIELEAMSIPYSKIITSSVGLYNRTEAYEAIIDVNSMLDNDTVHSRVLQKLLQESLQKQSTENSNDNVDGSSTSIATSTQKQNKNQQETQFISLEHVDDDEVNSKNNAFKRWKRNANGIDFNKFFGEDIDAKEEDVAENLPISEGKSASLVFDLRRQGALICPLCIYIQPLFAEKFGLGGGISNGIAEVVEIIKFTDWIFRAMDFNQDGFPENIGFNIRKILLSDKINFDIDNNPIQNPMNGGRKKREANANSKHYPFPHRHRDFSYYKEIAGDSFAQLAQKFLEIGQDSESENTDPEDFDFVDKEQENREKRFNFDVYMSLYENPNSDENQITKNGKPKMVDGVNPDDGSIDNENIENILNEFSRDIKKFPPEIALKTLRIQMLNWFQEENCCATLGFIFHDLSPDFSAATKRGICSDKNVAIISGYFASQKINKFDVFRGVMHALGHLFGASHNSFSSNDFSDQQLYDFLNPFPLHPIQQLNVGLRPNSFKFSSFAKDQITMFLDSNGASCLKTKSSRSYCGDGILDEGEACDCGAPWQCQQNLSPCCGERETFVACQILIPKKKRCSRIS